MTVELRFPEHISNFTLTFQDDPSYVKDWKSAEQCARNFINAIKNDEFFLEEVSEVRKEI